MTTKNMDPRLARARRHHARTRASGRARLLVFRSNRAIYAQIVDGAGVVLCGASNLKGKSGLEGAQEVGKNIAALAKKSKVTEVAFDRNGFQYHGQIKALADSAREAGLKF